MAKENLKVLSRITKLHRYIQVIDKRVEELTALKGSLENGDEAKDLTDGIQEVKKDQEDLKRRLIEVTREFALSIEDFGEKEDGIKGRLAELTLKFDEEGWCSFKIGEPILIEDYFSQTGIQLSEESDETFISKLAGLLSDLLLDFMVVLSKNDGEVLAKFQDFKSSLLVLAEGDKINAVNRVIDALEGMQVEFLERSSGGIEKTPLPDGELKDQLDKLFDKFRNEILLLEWILKYPRWSELKILAKRQLSSTKENLRQFQQDLKDYKNGR